VYWQLERKLAPGVRYSQAHYEEALNEALETGASWLDVGCGHQVLPPWRLDAERRLIARSGRVVGVDVDRESIRNHATIRLRALASLSALPFASETFDLVTANMVAEHLESPETQFAEVARVLRPGGVFLFHTPNARAYTTRLARAIPDRGKRLLVRLLEGRPEDDVFPTFYRVNTVARIHEVAAAAGLQVMEVRPVTSSAEFATILPLAFIELLWIRKLMKPEWQDHRPTLVGFLAKRPACSEH
jgi:SAM-dependent methyltransferase